MKHLLIGNLEPSSHEDYDEDIYLCVNGSYANLMRMKEEIEKQETLSDVANLLSNRTDHVPYLIEKRLQENSSSTDKLVMRIRSVPDVGNWY